MKTKVKVKRSVGGIKLDPTLYLKIFREDDGNKHNSLEYKDNKLIEDVIPFNDSPNASCVAGGIYYSDIDNIHKFMWEYGYYIRLVQRVANDPQIKDKDTSSVKWRSPRLYLHERKSLHDVETWKWLVSLGFDITKLSRFAIKNQETADFIFKNITEWKGYLYLRNNKNCNLPALTTVVGNLDVGGSENCNLPALTTVGGSLDLYNSKDCNLPALTSVGRYLNLRYSENCNLPALTSVGGSLDLYNSKDCNLPALTSVEENLYLRNNKNCNLPALTTVVGNLDVGGSENCNLPALTTVGGSLDVGGSENCNLPALTSVGGEIYGSNNLAKTLKERLGK